MPQPEDNEQSILSNAQVNQIRTQIQKEMGININQNDPVFAAVIMNKVILDGYIAQVVEALESLVAASNLERQKSSPAPVENISLNTEALNSIQQLLQRDRVRLIQDLVPVINENNIQSQPYWLHYLLAGISGAAIISIIGLLVVGFIKV